MAVHWGGRGPGHMGRYSAAPGGTPTPSPTPSVTTLSTVAVAPSAAWGFRRMVSGYTGNLFRVVRTSGGTTLDIGQDANGQPDLSGFAAFVSGSSAKVDIVYDQTGNGWHLTQTNSTNRPWFYTEDAFRGAYASTHDGGSNHFYDVPVGLTGDGRATTTLDIAHPASSNSGRGYAQLGAAWNGNGSRVLQLFGVNGYDPHVSLLNTAFNTTAAVVHGQPQVILAAYGAATDTARTNGVGGTRAAQTAGTWAGGLVGRASVPYPFGGQFFARVVYPATLNSTDMGTLETDSYAMWPIDPTPDFQLVMPGNSIVQGTSSVRSLHNNPRQADAYFSKRADVINAGVFGQTAATAYGNRATYSALYSASVRSLITVPEPTNDIDARTAVNVAGFGASIWASAVLPFIQAMITAGFTPADVLVPTVLPRNFTGVAPLPADKETERLSYNALVASEQATYGYTILDYAAIPAMLSTGGGNYADGVHPNSTNFASGLEVTGNGYGYMAKLLSDTVNVLVP